MRKGETQRRGAFQVSRSIIESKEVYSRPRSKGVSLELREEGGRRCSELIQENNF